MGQINHHDIHKDKHGRNGEQRCPMRRAREENVRSCWEKFDQLDRSTSKIKSKLTKRRDLFDQTWP